MIVENYSERYLSDVLRIVENFHKEAVGEYDQFIDSNSVIDTIKSSDPSNAFLLIIDGVCQGMIFGATVKSLVNGKEMFQEIIWYVNKGFRSHGLKLLAEVEKILKSRGISIIIMAVLENSKTQKLKDFYVRLGFKPMETHYVREL